MRIFEVGKPVPQVWLHNELDYDDTVKYLGGTIIPDQNELDRLVEKYLSPALNKVIQIIND